MKKVIIATIAGLLSFLGIYATAHAASVSWTRTGTTITPLFINDTVQLPGIGGVGTKCLQIDNSGNIAAAATACGSGGGGTGGGSWATTTSNVPGQLINYSLNNTDIVTIGRTSTTTAPFYFDPNTITSLINGLITTNRITATGTIASIFPYASTTAITTSGSTYLTGLSQGQLNVGAGGLLYSGATTTFSSPLSYSGGVVSCPTCALTSQLSPYPFPLPFNSTSTTVGFNNGLYSNASSSFASTVFLNGIASVANNVEFRWKGLSNDSAIKTSTSDDLLVQTGTGHNFLSREGCDQETCRNAITNNAFNTDLFTIFGGTGRATFLGPVTISTTTTRGLSVPYASTTIALTAPNAYITKLGNLTSNGFVKTSGSDGTLSVDTSTYLTLATLPFTYPFPAGATTTPISFNMASTTYISSTYASSTSYFGANLPTGCDPTLGKLLWSNGTFSCGTDAGGSGTGEANTGSSRGTGLNIYDSKSGVDLRFNSLAAGTNVTLSTTSNANTIVISATGGSGTSAYEIATTSNIAVPQVAYFTQTGGRTTLGGTATGTLTGTGNVSVTAGTSILGGNATVGLTNPLVSSFSLASGGFIIDSSNSYGAAGTILMSRGTAAGDVWVASTTFSTGLTFLNGNVTCDTASASVFGCLSAQSFSKFNSATTTFSSPLVYTGATNAVTCPTCVTSATSYGTTTATTTGLLSYNYFNTLFNNLYPKKQSAFNGTASSTASTTASYTFFGGFKDPSRNALWTNAGTGNISFANGAITVSPLPSSDVVAIRTLWSDEFQGYDRITLEVNFNGNSVLTAGDTPVFGFDQGGGRGIILTNFATNGVNGWQTIDIPISKMTSNYDATPTTNGTGTVINPANVLSNARFRYYENATGYSISIRNIRAYDSTGTLIEDFTNPDLFSQPKPGNSALKIQSIDVMKQSKDTVANQWSTAQMDAFVAAIAPLNPTHVAVSVPYDNEAGYPGGPYQTGFAQRWSESVRRGGYNVLWRQTWNAFEGIYSVTKSNAVGMGAATSTLNGSNTTSYLSQIYYYIINHPNQYAPGDIIVPLPEPANAGINGVTSCTSSTCQFPDAKVFRQWERDAVTVVNAALGRIGLKGRVFVGLYGETGDVGWGLTGGNPQGSLDERTLDSLKIIGIDHYPNPTSNIGSDIAKYEKVYGNFPLVSSEWGTLNETSTTTKGAAVDTFLNTMKDKPYFMGLNYWTAISGANENLFYPNVTPEGGFEALQKQFTSGKPMNLATHILPTDTYQPIAFPTSTPTSGQVLTASSATSTFWGTVTSSVASTFAYLFPNNATTTPLTFASSTNAGRFLAGNFLATSTATSTFNGGIDATRVCLTGTTTCLAPGGGSGEVNTGASLGTGLNIYDSKSGTVLNFNSLAAGTNVTLSTSSNANTIVINSTGGSGNSFAFPFDPVAGGNATGTALFLNGGFWTNASSTCYTSCTLNMQGSIVNNTGFNSGNVYVNDALQVAGTLLLGSAQKLSWNNDDITITNTATDKLDIEGGNLGIGTTSPYASLSVGGDSGVVAAKYAATSTTATSTFAGNVMVGTSLNNGMLVPGGGLLNAGTSPLQISQNVNDLENTAIIANTNLGAYAATCLSLFNGGSTFNGITSSNYSDLCFTGPNFNSASAPGGGLFLGSQIPGLPANSTVLVNSDGALLFGALSANSASSSMSWSIGPGYAMGNFDMVLKNVGANATNALNAGLGVGTTTPFARLGISASSTATYPYLVIASTTNGLSGANSGVFVVNNNGNVGIGSTTPGSILGIQNVVNFTTATSSFSSTGGLNLNGGCYAVNGVCNTANTGTVTSVAASVPSIFSISGSPITTSGTLAMTYSGTALPIANGGTGLTSVGASSTVLITNGSADFWQKLATSQLTNDSGFLTSANAVTSIATNNGLTGGTITTTGTLGLDITKLVSGALAMWNGSQLQSTGTPALTAGYFIATTTTASQLPYASTTAITSTGSAYFGTLGANVGVGTTTPFWTFQIASNTPYLAITDLDSSVNAKHGLISFLNGSFNFGTSSDNLTSTSSVVTFAANNAGHVYASTTAPTLSSGVVDGTDAYGRVTGASSPATVTFATPYTRTPSCVVTPETGSILNVFSYTISNTAIVVTETGLGAFNYSCHGI